MLGNESVTQTAQRFGGQYAAAPETPPELTVQYDVPWIWSGSAGNAAWTASGNWTAGSGFPGGNAAIVLGGSNSTSGTVDLLSAAPSVSHLTFEADKIVTITSTASGGGRLTLDNGSNPVGVVVSGSGHLINSEVAVALDSDAWITISGSSDSLSIAGNISNGTAAHGIIKDGLGTLILSGNDTYSGGTIVNIGILEIEAADALPDGTSVTVGAGGTLVLGSSVTPSVDMTATPMPEPGALALLIAAMAILLLGVLRNPVQWLKRFVPVLPFPPHHSREDRPACRGTMRTAPFPRGPGCGDPLPVRLDNRSRIPPRAR
jgi:autotransporter-associated beta strand protein